MSQALPGTHLCKEHQGNHSHYAQENCELCRAQAEIERLEEENEKYRLGMQENCQLRAEIERLKVEQAKYHEVLYAVSKVSPGESRHETALRYICEREAGAALNPEAPKCA